VDLPRPVSGASELLDAAGVLDRVTFCPQSFFDPLPTGLDLYVLHKVLDDWPDREAAQILTRCADAARPHGRVIVATGVTPDAVADPNLLMLVLVGGKTRTLDEFRGLARGAGLDVKRAGRNTAGKFLVECRAIIAS
jgi:hypothetical protein